MSVDKLIVKQKIAITLNSQSNNNIIPLLIYTPYSKSGYRLLEEYLEIENLKAVSWIYNLPAIDFPTFELEDSESKQLLAAINLEWQSARIQLDLMCQVDNSNIWQKIGAYSLLNPNPYPFREYSLGNHALGNNAMIGFRLVDVGSGILQNTDLGDDRVVIFGDLIRNISVEKLVDTSVKITNNITTIAATIVNSNAARKGITFFNSSTIIIYIDTISTVSTSSYLVRLIPGAYYEAPKPIYTGAYYAKTASGSTAIDIREFS